MARRTGTATPLGARFDAEADAFLILLLSIYVSQAYGGWVLVIGAARYALLQVGGLIPWSACAVAPPVLGQGRGRDPGHRAHRRRILGLLDRLAGMIAVAVALLLLAESFGRNVVWLYRTGACPRTRQALRLAITVLSVVLVWGVLVAPDLFFEYTLAAFARIPIEGLALMAVAVVLPWPGRGGSWPRSPESCSPCLLWSSSSTSTSTRRSGGRSIRCSAGLNSICSAIGVVRDTIGLTRTVIALAALGLGLLLLVGAITASAIHITTVAARHRRDAVRALAALTAVWALSAGLSLQLVPGAPVASASATGLAVTQSCATLRRRSATSAVSRRSCTAPTRKPASPPRTCSPGCAARMSSSPSSKATGRSPSRARVSPRALTPSSAGTPPRWPGLVELRHAERLAQRPPGFGGVSQLAHSTLLSGLWVNTEQRYAELVGSHLFTLVDAFDKAGWRTVNDSPEDEGHLAVRHAVLPLRQDLRPGQRRLPRPGLQLRLDARPVQPAPSCSGANSAPATSL